PPPFCPLGSSLSASASVCGFLASSFPSRCTFDSAFLKNAEVSLARVSFRTRLSCSLRYFVGLSGGRSSFGSPRLTTWPPIFSGGFAFSCSSAVGSCGCTSGDDCPDEGDEPGGPRWACCTWL